MKTPRISWKNISKKQMIAAFALCIFFIIAYFYELFIFIHKQPMQRSNVGRYLRVDQNCVKCQNKIFTTLLSNRNVCKTFNSLKGINLLILIFTIPEHYKERNTIRSTWLSPHQENKYGIRHIFLLGNSYKTNSSPALKKEHKLYGDILQNDFEENYYNLTLKTLMGLRWARKWCPRAKFVFKTDDDVYVNIPVLMGTIDANSRLLFSSVGGHCEINASVDRDISSKYYISKEQYNQDIYPGFCSGTGYVTSMHVVQNILDVVHNISFLQLEDVYVGLCLHKLNFTFSHLKGFKQHIPTSSNGQKILKYLNLRFNENCFGKLKGVVVIHEVSTEKMEAIWNSDCP